ncbi:glycosyltransferase family 4 protein, partial [Candidatus Omnitrophota bacterium]
ILTGALFYLFGIKLRKPKSSHMHNIDNKAKDRPLKIAYVHGYSNIIAGQEIILLNIIRNLNSTRYQAIAVLPQDGVFAEFLRAKGIEVRFIKLSRLKKKNPFSFISAVFKLLSLIKKEKIKIIHTSGLYPNQYCSVAAKIARIPCICHIHSTVYIEKEIKNSLLRFSDTVITVSEGVKQSIKTAKIEESKVKVIYNGIDQNEYKISVEQTASIKREFNLDNNCKIVGQVGQIIKRKGIMYFIKMAELVMKEMQNVKFLLVGDDKNEPGYMREMQGLVDNLKLSKHIIFTGFRKDIPQLISLMDIAVLSSLAEGLGMVLIEAMFLNKPVIATDIPGVNEVIENNITGLLVPPRDYRAMAKGVLTLLSDKDYAARLVKSAKNKVLSEFTIERQIKEIADIYEDLRITRKTKTEILNIKL